MDETYCEVKGGWRYLYPAVDNDGHTIDFLLIKCRQLMSAQSFLIMAIENNGMPELINIKIRQYKYLINIVEHIIGI